MERIVQTRKWEFGQSDQHIFLAALDRHWQSLLEQAEAKEFLLESREELELILGTVREIATAGENFTFVLSHLVEKELEFLEGLNANSRFDECGCSAETHNELLINWTRRNLNRP